MRTVLGLSKTSTSIGWVLVDGDDVSGEPLDHDAFDLTDASAVAPAATARRVRDIATATGYTVDSVHVTTSGNASSLRDALTDFGFADIVSVSLSEATRAWAVDAGRATARDRTAVCILGRDSASLSVIDTRTGATQATTTTVSRARVNVIEWLNAAFGNNGSRPEVLYLIGPRAKLEALEGPLAAALHIPVIATHDAQLALARGAAVTPADAIDDTAARERLRMAFVARTLGVVAAVAVGSVLTLSAAGAPIPLAGNTFHQRQSPPSPSRAADVPTRAAPAVPPPPPAPAAPAPLTNAVPRSAHARPYAVAPPTSAPIVATPEQHLPDAQPVEHLPDAQPAAAPGPIAPPAPGPLPPPSETIPPPQDPGQEAPNPLFDALP